MITPVDFDHESFLGSSIKQIAAEKAGILKPGVDSVIAPQRPEAEAVIAKAAHEPDFVRTDEFGHVGVYAHGSEFDFRGAHIRCPLAASIR